jgi:hypothetical protein
VVDSIDSPYKVEFTGEQLDAYRSRLTAALQEVGQYNGTEPSFQRLMEVLIDLERWMVQAVKLPEGRSVPVELQEALHRQAHGPQAVVETIESLLDRAIQRVALLLRGALTPAELAAAWGMYYEHRPSVLAPPGGGRILPGEGEGEEIPIHFEQRVQQLITDLQRSGVFLDDIIVRDGIINPRMMRKASYTLIEIPRLLWREVLVCDQVGEGTRVSQSPLGVETYERLRKSNIDQLPGVSRHHRVGDLTEWSGIVTSFLARGVKTSHKVDIHLLERLRGAVRSQFTAQEWLRLAPELLQQIEVPEGRLPEVVPKVCGEAFICNRTSQVEWGGRIYGFGDEAIAQARKELQQQSYPPIGEVPDWRARLRARFPTAAEWLRLKDQHDLDDTTWHELYAFGFDTDIASNFKELITLGERCYENGNPEFSAFWERIECSYPGRTIPLAERPKWWRSTLGGLQARMLSAIGLHSQGFTSLRVVRRIQREAEFLRDVAHITRQRLESNRPTSEDSQEVDWGDETHVRHDNAHLLLTVSAIANLGPLTGLSLRQAEDLINRVEVGAQEMLQMASQHERVILDEVAPAIERGMQRAPTMLTPLISVPSLELNESEAIFLQMLLNEGSEQECRYRDLARILDPQAKWESFPFSGSVDALAKAVGRKLERQRLGYVVRTGSGYTYTRTPPPSPIIT